MPVSPRIEVASQSFHLNARFLKQGLAGLNDEDWRKRPGDHSNNILWIVGHLTWSRAMVLRRLDDDWTLPWMKLYARGEKCVDSPECPSPTTVMEAWEESCGRLDTALSAATDEVLDVPVTQGPPTADGKMSGMINFMAVHETYHVGQCAYIRSLLGKPGVMG
jgi:uncharacterized damage-inducible protein DinB